MTSYTGSLTLAGASTITISAVPLALGATGYELLACGLDGIQRRRDTVTSPWIRGETEVASVQGALSYGFAINAVGSGLAGAIALATAVITLVQEKEWTLTETLDGHVETFACRAATSVDSPFDRTMVINARKGVTVSIPVKRV